MLEEPLAWGLQVPLPLSQFPPGLSPSPWNRSRHQTGAKQVPPAGGPSEPSTVRQTEGTEMPLFPLGPGQCHRQQTSGQWLECPLRTSSGRDLRLVLHRPRLPGTREGAQNPSRPSPAASACLTTGKQWGLQRALSPESDADQGWVAGRLRATTTPGLGNPGPQPASGASLIYNCLLVCVCALAWTHTCARPTLLNLCSATNTGRPTRVPLNV